MRQKPEDAAAPQAFYTVTAEIALARHQPRVAALQYAAAAAQETDVELLARATQVAAESLQPSLGGSRLPRAGSASIRSRWTRNARRREPRWRCTRSIKPPLTIASCSANSPIGTDAEFAALETELARQRQHIRRASARGSTGRVVSVLRGGAAGAGVRRAARGRSGRRGAQLYARRWRSLLERAPSDDEAARRELLQTLARARILAGDAEGPLAQAQETRRARRYARQSPRLRAAADDGAARFGGDRSSWRCWRATPSTPRWRCACWV